MSDIPERWTEAQKAIYAKVYRFMVTNPNAMRHPDMALPSTEHWQTVAHNAAWIAAEFLELDDLTIVDSDTNQIVAITPHSLNS